MTDSSRIWDLVNMSTVLYLQQSNFRFLTLWEKASQLCRSHGERAVDSHFWINSWCYTAPCGHKGACDVLGNCCNVPTMFHLEMLSFCIQIGLTVLIYTKPLCFHLKISHFIIYTFIYNHIAVTFNKSLDIIYFKRNLFIYFLINLRSSQFDAFIHDLKSNSNSLTAISGRKSLIDKKKISWLPCTSASSPVSR